MSIKWATAGKPRPRLLALPLDAASLDEAHEAIELWEFYSRKTVDPAQRLAVEVMMARDVSGRWAARTTGREMCRQNGKGDELEIVELWCLIKLGEAILHTAHELFTVASAHERMLGLLGHKDLQRKVSGVLNGVGQQSISFRNGGIIAYRTRTGGGGRGLDDISRIVVDEAQHAKREQLASSSSTMLVNPNPQMNVVGTGGIASRATEFSSWWWQIRMRCLNGDTNRFGYVGHTADDVSINSDGEIEQGAIDATDERLWYAANPVLHTPRGDIDFFREELKNLGPDLFAREHLCVWDPPHMSTANKAKIDPHEWRKCADLGNKITGRVVVGVDTTYDLDRSALAIVGRNTSGRRVAEIVQHDDGSHWLEVALLDVIEHNEVSAVTFDATGPAKALRPMLERILAEHNKHQSDDRKIKLESLTMSRYQASCAAFVSDVAATTIGHRSDTRLTNLAVSVPARKSGEGWFWDRRSGDIGPLVAVTCAAAIAEALPMNARRSAYEDDGLLTV